MNQETRIVNLRRASYDIYIGRGSLWGNPWFINDEIGMTREVVIEKYRQWLRNSLESGAIPMVKFLALQGKVLGCYCKPLPCHGDVIKELLDEYLYTGVLELLEKT